MHKITPLPLILFDLRAGTLASPVLSGSGYVLLPSGSFYGYLTPMPFRSRLLSVLSLPLPRVLVS